MTSFSFELEDIDSAAKKLIEEAGSEKIWVFHGQMGAGKTTLIKSLAKQFKVIDQVSSPTFGLVNHYENSNGEIFYHFDFYRLERPEEALDIGIDEYFYSTNICWLEWAENIFPFLPDEYFLIRIDTLSETQRKITLEHIHA